jgi:hypothetical protein
MRNNRFSDKEIFCHYFKREKILEQLISADFQIEEVIVQDYEEESGEITKDIFVIAQKGTNGVGD